MTSTLFARRRAEEFAALVDGGAPGTSRGTAGPRAEVVGLLDVVSTLRTHTRDAAVTPRPDFASDLRIQLLTEAESLSAHRTAPLTLPVRPRGPRERRLVAAASAVVLLGGSATMAAAAQSALPGEALYPVKRGIERIDVSLSDGAANKGRDLLAQADSRLAEVDALIAGESAQGMVAVPATLAVFASQANEGSSLLLASFEATGDRDSVRSIRTFTRQAITQLEGMAGAVPATAEDELAIAAMALRDIDEQADRVCASCLSDLPAADIPDAFVARAEVDRALGEVTSIRLFNSHPVVVPKGSVDQPRADRAQAGKRTRPATDKSGTTPRVEQGAPAEPGDATDDPTQQAPEQVPAGPEVPTVTNPDLPGSDGQPAGGQSAPGGGQSEPNQGPGPNSSGEQPRDNLPEDVVTLIPDAPPAT
jgi:hypothetical protein